MATVTTEVDVELDEFSTREILTELNGRNLNGKDRAYLKDIAKEILNDELPVVKTLIDKMKLEAFINGFQNKTLDEIQNFFK